MSYYVTYYACKDCGNREEFLERGQYQRNIVCNPRTGEFRDHDCMQTDTELTCCAKCDSINLDIRHEKRPFGAMFEMKEEKPTKQEKLGK